MSTAFNTSIVIPCYNEEKGISNSEYSNFLENNPEAFICFVNDGSTDNTLAVLNVLKEKHPTQIHVLSLEKNSGKAEAVRAGIKYCNKTYQHQFIGYLDADLATTLEEFIGLRDYLQGEIVFSFGSRIRKVGSTIERENSRFLEELWPLLSPIFSTSKCMIPNVALNFLPKKFRKNCLKKNSSQDGCLTWKYSTE